MKTMITWLLIFESAPFFLFALLNSDFDTVWAKYEEIAKLICD